MIIDDSTNLETDLPPFVAFEFGTGNMTTIMPLMSSAQNSSNYNNFIKNSTETIKSLVDNFDQSRTKEFEKSSINETINLEDKEDNAFFPKNFRPLITSYSTVLNNQSQIEKKRKTKSTTTATTTISTTSAIEQLKKVMVYLINRIISAALPNVI